MMYGSLSAFTYIISFPSHSSHIDYHFKDEEIKAYVHECYWPKSWKVEV